MKSAQGSEVNDRGVPLDLVDAAWEARAAGFEMFCLVCSSGFDGEICPCQTKGSALLSREQYEAAFSVATMRVPHPGDANYRADDWDRVRKARQMLRAHDEEMREALGLD